MNDQINPTRKQRDALLRFGIPQEQINIMNFQAASKKLDELITAARKKNPNYTNSKPQSVAKSIEAKIPVDKPPEEHNSTNDGELTQKWADEALDEVLALGLGTPSPDSSIVASLISAKATMWATNIIHSDTVKKLEKW